MGVIIAGSLTLIYALPKIAVVGAVLVIMMVATAKSKAYKESLFDCTIALLPVHSTYQSCGSRGASMI